MNPTWKKHVGGSELEIRLEGLYLLIGERHGRDAYGASCLAADYPDGFSPEAQHVRLLVLEHFGTQVAVEVEEACRTRFRG